MFRRRSNEDGSHDRERLAELEDQRRVLLLESGRLSLTAAGGMGLPEDFLAALAQNTALTFHPQSCDQTALSEWRSRQRQLAHP